MSTQGIMTGVIENPGGKCTSMDFLNQLTRGNPRMILEMLRVYLEETPRLLLRLKQAIEGGDWDTVARTAHALVPSFATVGMSKEYSMMMRNIQEYAEKREKPDSIHDIFSQIERACNQAFSELEQVKTGMEQAK